MPRREDFGWDLRYRTAPFAIIQQTGWDSFGARAECWGGVHLGMDPATLKILSWFSEPTTAQDAYADLKPFIAVPRAEFAATLTKMMDTGLLGLDGQLHRRLVPKVASKVRLGRPFDGGYVIPAGFASLVDGLLAFGVGDDLSFENEFCDQHPGRALAFDHIIQSVPYRRPKVEFVPKGVGPKASADLVTLNKVVLDGPFLRPMMKMDIEGAEWRVLATCSDRVFKRVPIMVFELHGMLANTPLQNLVFTRLLEHYEPIHVHANNVGPALEVAGQLYPEWLEVTFVHKELVGDAAVDRGGYPTKHDYPNTSERDDMKLGWWKTNR
jgi:hypothetical protein